MALSACPFCRELFREEERAACPVCGVALVPFDKLSPSDEALDDDVPRRPEHERLPLLAFGRGRGLLAAIALAGLAAFFLPWVRETLPDVVTFSGGDLARRLGWVWAAGIAWFVLLPTVLSRRTIIQMRGARVAASFLSAIPGVTAGVLLARPPHGSHGVPVRLTFELGAYATLVLSLAAVGVAVVLGGRTDRIALRRGTSSGQVVH
jgi:hypothetical protein